jgi:rhodanese-related sulfurtransferase
MMKLDNHITLSDGNVPEVTVRWLREHLDDVTLVDVRETDELVGPLGHISGVRHVPLGKIGAFLEDASPEEPFVFICRSGGRSGDAALKAKRAGVKNVASLAGGMISWNEAGFVSSNKWPSS